MYYVFFLSNPVISNSIFQVPSVGTSVYWGSIVFISNSVQIEIQPGKLSCCQGLMSRFTHGHVCLSYLQMCTIITICFQNMNRQLSYRQSNLQVQAPWVWCNIVFPFLEKNILAASKSKCNLYASRLNQSRTSL